MEFREVLAAERLGLTRAESLPDLAINWIQQGLSSQALILLAGSSRRDDPRDLHDLLRQAARELGISVDNKREAADILKQYWAREVVAGKVAPNEGAYHIIQEVYHSIYSDLEPVAPGGYAGGNWGIAELLGTYYSLDDVDEPESIVEIERDLIRLCAVIVRTESTIEPAS